MRIKYNLLGGIKTFTGDFDLYLVQMQHGHDELTNEFWITFPVGFEYRTTNKVQFIGVKDALVSLLTSEVDDAILEGIGTMESGPGPDRGYRHSDLATGLGFFSNSRCVLPLLADEAQDAKLDEYEAFPNPIELDRHLTNSPVLTSPFHPLREQ